MKLGEKLLLVLLGAFLGFSGMQAQLHYFPDSFTSPEQKQFMEYVTVILKHNQGFQGKVGIQFKYNIQTLKYLLKEVDNLKGIFSTEI